MVTYSIVPSKSNVAGVDALHLALSFGDPASNDTIVREVDGRMRELKKAEVTGGRLVLLEGPASLPVITVIAHHVSHLFGAVGVYDPKLKGYVVAISHDPAFSVGAIVRAGVNGSAESLTEGTTP